jgi:hypothetical protein
VQRPLSKNTAAVQRDVAVANELPLSEEPAAPRKKTSTVVYGSDESKAAASAARAAFEEAPKPAPGPAATNPAPQGQPLNDLFSDVGAPSSTTNKLSELVADAPQPAAETSTSGQLDPFAQLAGPVKEGEAPAIGEATKFFIARAGVNKRNPPWKIALFILGGIGIPVLIGWVLTTFGVVQMPTVTRVGDDGQEVQEPFFSPSGLGGLKDVLTGDAKRKKEEADRQRKQREQAALAAKAAADRNKGTTNDAVEDKPVQPKPVDPTLAQVFEDDRDRLKKPIKFRNLGDDNNTPTVNASGLSQEAIGRAHV